MDDKYIHWSDGHYGDSRCIGFFTTLDRARKAAVNDIGNFVEYRGYNYCVIEQIDEEGVSPQIVKEWWYCFDEDKGVFVEIENPIEMRYFTNHCLG